MPEQIIDNTFKTETIQDVNLPKKFTEWAQKTIPQDLFIALLPLFEKSFRQNGARDLNSIIERYAKIINTNSE